MRNRNELSCDSRSGLISGNSCANSPRVKLTERGSRRETEETKKIFVGEECERAETCDSNVWERHVQNIRVASPEIFNIHALFRRCRFPQWVTILSAMFL